MRVNVQYIKTHSVLDVRQASELDLALSIHGQSLYDMVIGIYKLIDKPASIVHIGGRNGQ